MTKSFKVNNKAEELDLLQTIERELPEARWRTRYKPTEWLPSKAYISFPYIIIIDGNLVSWGLAKHSSPNWQIGQSLHKSALEQLLEIPENPDGSITISKELQVQLVKEGRLK